MKKFSIDYSFFILLIMIFFSPKQDIIIKLFLALFIHEFSHIFLVQLFKYKIESLKLSAFGFFMKLEKTKNLFYKDFFIYIVGVVSNFILFFLVKDSEFKIINLVIAIINLIPIYPLDGFNVLKTVLLYFFPFYHISILVYTFSVIINFIGIIVSIRFGFDLVISISLIYLLIINLIQIINIKNIYNIFLMDKMLYNYEYPIKKIRFHQNFSKYLYKYHQIELKIGNRKIVEKDILKL